MTVFSINKQALEQSNLTHASAKQADSAQALFTAALAQHQVRIGPVSPTPGAAFKANFDRPAAEPRPERAERAAKQIERADRRPSERFERPKADSVERPERPARETQPAPEARVSDAPKAEKPNAAESEPQSAAPAEQSTAPEAAPALEAEAVAVVAPTQNAAPTQTAQVTAAATGAAAPTQSAEDGDADLDPFAWLAKEFGPEIEDLEAQIDAGDGLVDLDVDFADLAPAQGQAQSSAAQKAAAPQGPAAVAPEIADDLVSAQASDMARKLAGTGANVKVAVTVDSAPQAVADPAVVKAEAAPALDTKIAQALSPDGSANGKGQNGQAGSQQGGQQNAGLANASQQVAGNPAIANAQAAAAARPFAAQLAAQVEGSSQSGQQGGTAPASAMGPGAAQNAAKPAPAQAAQAPQPPRHVDPKQVIDQVSVQIARQAKGGADTIRVQLKPVDLGRIEIRLEVQDGKVTAHVSADNKETLAILQKDARGLERALQDAGLKTESNSMNFSLSGDGQQARNDAKPARRSRLSRASKAIGDAPQQAAAQPMRSGGRRGVDIKV